VRADPVHIRRLFDEARADRARVLEELFQREADVAETVARAALGPGGLDVLLEAGLLQRSGGGVRSLARITRFHGQLIASDRHGFRRHADFVLGPGPSSHALASAVRPISRGRVLDLGCGPGTFALWLARDGVDALGIDINPRAVEFAGFNRRLNGRSGAAFSVGDFLTAPPDPSLDESFDLVVANPPFVLAPTSELTYRDRPLSGDDTTRVAVERVLRAVRPGGRGYIVGSWIDNVGRWDAAPHRWLRGDDVRAALTLISSVSTAEYAASWNRDLSEPARSAATAAWCLALEAEGVTRISTGVIGIQRSARRANAIRARFLRSGAAAGTRT
jgi:methylase of polypeptide subunit release factors